MNDSTSRRTFLMSALALPLAPLCVGSVTGDRSAERDDRLAVKNLGVPYSAEISGIDGLLSRYTFDNFVVAKNNEYAYDFCRYYAKIFPNDIFNPVFIFAPSGMGGSHLMHSIGNFLKTRNPSPKVLMVNAEKFIDQTIKAARATDFNSFRRKYRQDCDLLLMENIEFLGRGKMIQEEFYNTLNFRKECGLPTVITGEQKPEDMIGLWPKIRRQIMHGGITVHIRTPDLNTRETLLTHQSDALGLSISKRNIREMALRSERCSPGQLRSRLIQLRAYSEFKGQPISIGMIRKIFG